MSLRFLDEAEEEYLGALRHYLEIDDELAIDLSRAVDERLERGVEDRVRARSGNERGEPTEAVVSWGTTPRPPGSGSS